ncbi:MAG TPA: hypothetical protein VLI94_08865 [Solirubrobacterales bacterium]|nr:hypothetical protein [Solirubrobacterales bacterium]
MKYVRTLGLLAVAATALMAFAGTASATLTSPPGTKYGGEIVATSTNTQLDGTVDITCGHSEIAVQVNTGATSGIIRNLTFTNCSRTVTPEYFIEIPSLRRDYGSVSIDSAGTVRSSWVKVTVQTTILGFPVHCIYKTSITDVGTLTEGVAPAKMHIGSAPIPQETTSGLCGEDAEWTGTYTVTKPFSAITID